MIRIKCITESGKRNGYGWPTILLYIPKVDEYIENDMGSLQLRVSRVVHKQYDSSSHSLVVVLDDLGIEDSEVIRTRFKK